MARLKQVQILDPVIGAQGLRDERGQLRVAVGQPAAWGHAVGLVLELLREDLHEVLQAEMRPA